MKQPELTEPFISGTMTGGEIIKEHPLIITVTRSDGAYSQDDTSKSGVRKVEPSFDSSLKRRTMEKRSTWVDMIEEQSN